MMFKVGDKVRCVANNSVEQYLDIGIDYEVRGTSYNVIAVAGVFGSFQDWRFKLVENGKPKYSTPIETIPAKRVLKSGTYGKLHVHTGVAHSDMVGVSLTNVDVHGVTWLGVEDLDELIFTLTQVREFLKDG